jgi:hypothetical protein
MANRLGTAVARNAKPCTTIAPTATIAMPTAPALTTPIAAPSQKRLPNAKRRARPYASMRRRSKAKDRGRHEYGQSPENLDHQERLRGQAMTGVQCIERRRHEEAPKSVFQRDENYGVRQKSPPGTNAVWANENASHCHQSIRPA